MPRSVQNSLLLSVFLLIFLSMDAMGQSAPQYFYNRANFPVGDSANQISIADMNGDGRADLIVASAGVSIYLGQPDATFAAQAESLSIDSSVNALATADFNGDGKMDVAVTSSDGIDILLGNGDGTLTSAVAYPTQNYGYFLQVADLNHDGKPDLVSTGTCGSSCISVSVLLGKGDGTFQAAINFSSGGLSEGMTISDLNGDGIPDLIFANITSAVSPSAPGFVTVMLGNGDGTYKAPVNYQINDSPLAVAAGDVTGDKIPDLVVTGSTVDGFFILKGNGDGTFQSPQIAPTVLNLGSSYIKLIDLNKDGKLDLVMNTVFNGGVDVFMGNGNGTFQSPQTYSTGNDPYFFTTADVNGDGNIDLAVVNPYANRYVTVLLGNGNGTFSPRSNLPLTNSQINFWRGAVADFDGDGLPDIAAYNLPDDTLNIFLSKGDGTFKQPKSTIATHGLNSIIAADFNRDGRADLLLDGISLLLGKGDGTFQSALGVVTDTGFFLRAVGDFNGDGIPDVVGIGSGSGPTQPLYVYLGNGDGTFQSPITSSTVNSYPPQSIVGDFNHDGKLDLAVLVNPNGVDIYLGYGNGTFAMPVLYATDNIASNITTADLNGDGILDLVVTADNIDVFIGKGDGTFPTRVDYTPDSFTGPVTTGDFNGDGKLDIAVSEYGSSSSVEILLGNGDGTFQSSHSFAETGYIAPPVYVADFNRDGTDDLLVAGGNGSLFLSAPIATISPASLNFGVVETGIASAPESITVTNSGNGPLNVTAATVGVPFSIVQPICQQPLARLANCAIPVELNAPESDTYTSQVLIQEDALNSKPIVPVVAITAVPSLNVNPPSLSFGSQDVGSSSASQSITLSNTSKLQVTVDSITATGPFSVSSQCGSSLQAGASCSVAVTFAPTATGNQTGTLTIADDATGSPQAIALTGAGVAALSITAQSSGSLSATIDSGQTASYLLNLNAGPNFSGTASFTCSGAPANTTCTISPSSLTLNIGQIGAFTVSVAAAQQSAANVKDTPGRQLAASGLLACVIFAPIALWRRRKMSVLGLSLIFFLPLFPIAILLGCSGGSSSQKSPTPPTIAAGTYQITVSAASGAISTSQALTLVVR